MTSVDSRTLAVVGGIASMGDESDVRPMRLTIELEQRTQNGRRLRNQVAHIALESGVPSLEEGLSQNRGHLFEMSCGRKYLMKLSI